MSASNASTLNPYSFSVKYADNTAIGASSLVGAVVDVIPPGGGAAITVRVVSTSSVGSTDSLGDAQGFVVTYQITPPGGTWTAADNGIYAVTPAGTPVADLSGNTVAAGTLGTFSVSVVATPASATFLK